MGEWSKSIGEKGERITKFIFEEILGVNSLIENASINCVKGEKHKRSEAASNRQTHGLDGLYYFVSPMEDELLDIVVVSSKYTTEYPKYPKSKFKDHVIDLAHSIECFKLSERSSNINQKFNSVTKTEFTGILVWLSNSNETSYDLIPKVSNSIIDNKLEFEKIILLDNARVNFLYETIYKAKQKYSDVKYVYHNTSLNIGSINKQSYGSQFPVNYLYSDIITLRIEENGNIIFLVFVNDNFDKINFSQILSFAKSYDYLNAAFSTYIYYLDYDKLIHDQVVKEVLVDYQNFKYEDNLFVNKFPADFRN